MALGGGLLCIKLSKASPKEWKVLEFPYISQQGDVGRGAGILPLCRSTGLASGVGKAALENQVLSDSLHGAQERVEGTKAALPPGCATELWSLRWVWKTLQPPQMLQVECGVTSLFKVTGVLACLPRY